MTNKELVMLCKALQALFETGNADKVKELLDFMADTDTPSNKEVNETQ